MDTLELRPAEPGDEAAVTRCVRAAYAKYVPRMDREPAPMLADYGALIAAGEVHVLAAGGAPVGVLVMRPAADHLFVDNVAVHPDRQGRGLGRRLMAFAEGFARARGLSAVRLYTHVLMTENVELYRRLGFRVTERRQEDGYDRVYMEKRIASSTRRDGGAR